VMNNGLKMKNGRNGWKRPVPPICLRLNQIAGQPPAHILELA